MIKIERLTNEEIIDQLNDSEGKVPSNVFLIPITYPDEVEIIGEKDNVLPLTFGDSEVGSDAISLYQVLQLIKFIKRIVSHAENNSNTFVAVTSQQGIDRANSIISYIAEYAPKSLIDFEYFDTKNFHYQQNIDRGLYLKLNVIEYLSSPKYEPIKILSQIAFEIVKDDRLPDELKTAAYDYLNKKLKVETEKLCQITESSE